MRGKRKNTFGIVLMILFVLGAASLPGCACGHDDGITSSSSGKKDKDKDRDEDIPEKKSEEKLQSEKIQAELAELAMTEDELVAVEGEWAIELATSVEIPAFAKYMEELTKEAEEACSEETTADEFELKLMELLKEKLPQEPETVQYDILVSLSAIDPEKELSTWTKEEMMDAARQEAMQKEIQKYWNTIYAKLAAEAFEKMKNPEEK